MFIATAALAAVGTFAATGPPASAHTGGPGDSAPVSASTSGQAEPVARGSGGAVSSVDLDATRAGIQVLRHGGNAIDAAVATAATLGVTEPFVAGPGGGGFMVIYLARQHRVVTIDGRETCPSACTKDLFVEKDKPLEFEQARHSGLAVGVPGMVATWAQAAHRYGKRGFAADLRPAIDRAVHGFRIDDTFVQETKESLADLQAFTSSRKLFLRNGQPLPVGSTLRNPDLAHTYRMLARRGPRYLYDGPLARAIAHTVQHPPVWSGTPLTVRPGIMTKRDLARYRADQPAPTHVGYRGYDVYGMAPPSSGGSTTGEALNILSGYDMGGDSRALSLHHYIESLRYAFADRNRYVGDPKYVDVPLQGLLDPAFAATRRCLITNQAASSPVAPGDPTPPYDACPSTGTAASSPDHEQSTNNIVTADKWGNVVAYTNTIEHFAGTGMTVPGYGFLLNNEMTDFDFGPASPGVPDVNLPAGGKRPRSSMNPTIVLRNGVPAFAVGSPGGATIITTVLQILLNHIDFGMPLEQAIAAPRVGNFNTPDSFAEQAFLDLPVAKTLEQDYGQTFSVVTGPQQIDKEIGAATGIELLRHGRFLAAAEPVRRGGGSAMVVQPR
ncbi:MAG TPA: gamma-glutamyltransferase [Nocardioidaceae bacterium]|nr:gamma-glutamyltransferase [Nocardioidaceae bacterium]